MVLLAYSIIHRISTGLVELTALRNADLELGLVLLVGSREVGVVENVHTLEDLAEDNVRAVEPL